MSKTAKASIRPKITCLQKFIAETESELQLMDGTIDSLSQILEEKLKELEARKDEEDEKMSEESVEESDTETYVRNRRPIEDLKRHQQERSKKTYSSLIDGLPVNFYAEDKTNRFGRRKSGPKTTSQPAILAFSPEKRQVIWGPTLNKPTHACKFFIAINEYIKKKHAGSNCIVEFVHTFFVSTLPSTN
jgi:TolA-binding protein